MYSFGNGTAHAGARFLRFENSEGGDAEFARAARPGGPPSREPVVRFRPERRAARSRARALKRLRRDVREPRVEELVPEGLQPREVPRTCAPPHDPQHRRLRLGLDKPNF